MFQSIVRVLVFKNVITFQGNTVAELEEELENCVDDYLEWCAKYSRTTRQTFFWKFTRQLLYLPTLS